MGSPDGGKDLREMYERQVKVLSARPAAARSRGQARARLADGMLCEIGFGEHRLRADAGKLDGGDDRAPTPGQIVRAGLVGCLSIGYRVWAARLGVPLGDVEVDITCELDARGQLGIDGVPVGWQRIAWTVRVTSDADPAEVLRVLDQADRLSPMLASMDRGIERVRTVEIQRRS
jgi:putative redox protein